MYETPSNFWKSHSRNLAASGFAAMACIVLAILNLKLFHWIDLYTSMHAAATVLTVLVTLAAFFPWQDGRFRKWAGFIVPIAALVTFFALERLLEDPGHSSLDRNRWSNALPPFYALIFGAPAWAIKAFLIGTVKPGGLSVGNQKVLPPAEGLHAVHTPPNPAFNIVFLHGIHGDYFSTWSKDAEKRNYWPEWIGKEFPNAAVYSAQYNAFVTNWKGGTMPLFDRATSVLNMCDNKRLFQRSTIFVVHSYGGLVLKEMWRAAHDRSRADVTQSVRGAIFLATPHSGSTLGGFLPFVQSVGRATVTAHELRHADPNLRALNIWYRNRPIRHNFVYYETQPTPPLPLKVVDESSADPGIPGVYPVAIYADHISLCKPEQPGCEIDASVRRNIAEIMQAPPPSRLSRSAGGSDLEIEITRETGGKLSRFALQLNDLLIAPYGIAALIDDYVKNPSQDRWNLVQERAYANHQKLEGLLTALEELKQMPFFGNFFVDYRDIANATERLIDAKMHRLYVELEGYGNKPPKDGATLARLGGVARDSETYNDRVREIQAALSTYLENNKTYLRAQLAVNVQH
jgi:hypothetical protein